MGNSDVLGLKEASQNTNKSIEKVVDGVKYSVEKVVGTTGEIIYNIYQSTAQGLVLVYTDTERNVLRTLNNTQLLIANAYMSTEKDIVHGVRSPIEKTLHMIDNHADQIEIIINNALMHAYSIGNMMLIMIFFGILLFFILFGKDVIIQIVEIVKNFNLSFK